VIGVWTSFSRMPMWKRLLFASPVVFVCSWVVLSLQTGIWVQQFADGISESLDSDVEYDDTFFELDGDFGATGVTFTKYLPDGSVGGTYKIDRVTFTTPGLVWLLRNSYFKASKYVPETAGIVLDNPRNAADDANTPGNYTNLPYDAMGCTNKLLTHVDLSAMGMDVPRQVTLRLDRDNDTASTAVYRMRAEGVGELEMKLHVDFSRPATLWTAFEDLQEAPLRSARLKFTDLGFVAGRNAHCAKQHQLTAAAFAEYHMQEVGRRLREESLTFTPGTLEHYRDFAERGGTLELQTTGARDLTLGQFVKMTRHQELQAFPVEIAANGKPPAAFGVSWNPNAQSAAAADATAMQKAAPTETSVTFANAGANSATATATAAALPAPRSVVPYADLSALTGHHIDVATNFGTLRKGTLQLAGPLAISIKLDAAEGGRLLTMPRDSIGEIRFTPTASKAIASPVAMLEKASTNVRQN